MNYKFVFVLMCIFLLSVFKGYAENLSDPVKEVKQAINQDTKDVERFLSYRIKLQSNVSKKEKEKLDFAIAEYYFKLKDYNDAQMAFAQYLADNPEGIGALLANTYLYKLAGIHQKKDLAANIKKELFKNQFVLLFDKFKVINYTSLNKNEYKIHYFLDHIEFYLNGDIFEKVSP